MVAVQPRGVPSLFTISLILFFVGIFLFVALLNGQRDLAMLSFLVLCMAGGLRYWARLSPSRIRCRLSLDKNRVFAGENFTLKVHAENGKFLPVSLEVNVPIDGLSSHSLSGETALTAESSLLWQQMTRFQWELTATRRGVHEIGPLGIASGDLFGFFLKELEIGARLQVVVYPRLVPLGPFSVLKRDFFGVPGSQNPIKDPIYILGTTDYQHGRPAKYIHWKASASHHRLQEKIFEPTQQEKVLLVVDVGQFAKTRAEEAFERTLEVVASLAVELDRQGCAVGLLTNGAMVGGASPILSMTRSPRQVSRILEALARLKIEPRETLIDTLRCAVKVPWGTSCVYFTFELDETTRAVREHLKRCKTPVMLLTFEAISALRRDKPVDINAAAGPDSNPIKEVRVE